MTHVAWTPLVSVFCGSGVVNVIGGKQMTPLASERSIFSEYHDYKLCIKVFSVTQ